MKLTDRTTPQARDNQCDKCRKVTSNIYMYDENICYDCYDKIEDVEDGKETKI